MACDINPVGIRGCRPAFFHRQQSQTLLIPPPPCGKETIMTLAPIPGNPFEIYTYSAPNGVKRKALRYNGADVYLGGIYAPTPKLDGGFDSMMQFLATNENNFFRHWLVQYGL